MRSACALPPRRPPPPEAKPSGGIARRCRRPHIAVEFDSHAGDSPMTPQERELLTNLIGRLRQAPAQTKDQEADQLIGQLVRERPDAAYVLAQTVLIQDYSLHQAQARIAELESQPAAAAGGAGSFLGNLF